MHAFGNALGNSIVGAIQQADFDANLSNLSGGAREAYDNVIDRGYTPQQALEYAQEFEGIEAPISRMEAGAPSIDDLSFQDFASPDPGDVIANRASLSFDVAMETARGNANIERISDTNGLRSIGVDNRPAFDFLFSDLPQPKIVAPSPVSINVEKSLLEPADYVGEILGGIGDGLERFAEKNTPKMTDLERLFSPTSTGSKILSAVGKKALAVPGVVIDGAQTYEKLNQSDYFGASKEAGGLVGGLAFAAGAAILVTPLGLGAFAFASIAIGGGLFGTGAGKIAGGNIANAFGLEPKP